jgi:hypothetical protein
MASTSWSHMPAMSPASPIPQDRPYACFLSCENSSPLLKGAQNAALELLRSRSRKLYLQMREMYPQLFRNRIRQQIKGVLDELFFVSDQFQLLSAPELQKRSIGHSRKAVKQLHAHAGARCDTQLYCTCLTGRTACLKRVLTPSQYASVQQPELRSARIITITSSTGG